MIITRTQTSKQQADIDDMKPSKSGWDDALIAHQQALEIIDQFPDLRQTFTDGKAASKEQRRLNRIIDEKNNTINLLTGKLEQAQAGTAIPELEHEVNDLRTRLTTAYAENLRLKDAQTATPAAILVQTYKDLNDDFSTVSAENSRFREQLSKALRIIERYRKRSNNPPEIMRQPAGPGVGNTCPHCQQEREARRQAEQELEQERERYSNLDRRHTDLYLKWSQLYDWTKKLFANTTVPTACKMVLWFLYHSFYFTQSNNMVDSEKHITIQEIASGLGCDEKTVRNACRKTDLWNVTTTRHEDIPLEGGKKLKDAMVYFTMHETVEHPETIKMEKLQGGDRTKKCPKCGSEDIDRYTVQYCRCCNENDWYFQPTTRNDAPYEMAQKAKNRLPYGKGAKQDAPDNFPTGTTEKQDALREKMDRIITEVDTELVAIHTENATLPAGPGVGNTEDPANDPYQQAEKTLMDLLNIGYELQFLPDGRKNIKRTGTTKAPNSVLAQLKEQIIKHEDILRDFLTTPPNEAFLQEKALELAQLDAEHSNTVSRARCSEPQAAVCHSRTPLNKRGEPAKGLDKIVSYSGECGSTHFYYSTEEKIHRCRKCDTELKPVLV